jgi:hypothetical protein
LTIDNGQLTMEKITIFAARYTGSCGFCRRPIVQGDRVGYDARKKRTLCYRCAEVEYESESMRQMAQQKLM